MLGGLKGLGLLAVSGEGRGLDLTGGLEELAERSADIAAAYDEDMSNWSLMSSSTAKDECRRQQRSGKSYNKKHLRTMKNGTRP